MWHGQMKSLKYTEIFCTFNENQLKILEGTLAQSFQEILRASFGIHKGDGIRI